MFGGAGYIHARLKTHRSWNESLKAAPAPAPAPCLAYLASADLVLQDLRGVHEVIGRELAQRDALVYLLAVEHQVLRARGLGQSFELGCLERRKLGGFDLLHATSACQGRQACVSG